MKRVAYHRLAAKELVKSALFYDSRRAGLGDEFVSEVDVAVAGVRANTDLGRRGVHGTQSCRTKRFPFRVVYLVQPDRIWIVAVAHLSRRPGYWAGRVK